MVKFNEWDKVIKQVNLNVLKKGKNSIKSINQDFFL